MLNNYDKIANIYDKLSRLIYGKAQVNAQIDQLKFIPKGGSVLIVGGGTGWILEEISKIHPSGIKITYVEISAKMIALSKVRAISGNSVKFVNIGIEHFDSEELFDVISTPFLFDNFNASRIEEVFCLLHNRLKPNGLWLLVDFTLREKGGKWWKWMLLKSMYLFFRLLKIIEARRLIDMEHYFLTEKYTVLEQRLYYSQFIKSTVFKKPDEMQKGLE